MSRWESAGNGLEAKVTKKGELLLREGGQTSEYPHFTVRWDSQGNMDWEDSPSRSAKRFGRNEILGIALTFLRSKGML